MSDETIVASAITTFPHLVAFDRLAKERFANIPIDALLIYFIDTVNVTALPFLARQFDVLGYKGWKLAKTEQEQREVIKRAIELHRFAGTVWAVKEALKTIGYPDAVLVEHALSGPNGWATFRIEINAGNNPISVTQIEELVKMIKVYKNARSHLIDVSYKLELDDAFSIQDDSYEAAAVDDGDNLFVGGSFQHNGEFRRDGSRNYSLDTDILTIQIINV